MRSNASRIAELSLELAAAERVIKSRPELEGDSVARREVIGRVAAVRNFLQEGVGGRLPHLQRYWQGDRQGAERGSSLSSIASAIAALVFPRAPTFSASC